MVVENLFVYHKHGGSFLSEEKERLIEENLGKLTERYPDYLSDVARFCEENPHDSVRSFLYLRMRLSKCPDIVVAINHLLGGGATSFLDKEKKKHLLNNGTFATISYCMNDGCYHVEVEHKDCHFQFVADTFESALSPFDMATKILINELSTYPHLGDSLSSIVGFAESCNIPTTFFLHDYLPICPGVNLLDGSSRYCGLPADRYSCQACYDCSCFEHFGHPETMLQYRKGWQDFLERCNEVICFSNASRELLVKAFPDLGNCVTKPHETARLTPVDSALYHHDGVRVGILGNLCTHKGAGVVSQAAKAAADSNQAIRFVHFGRNESDINVDIFRSVNEYKLEALSTLVRNEEIDVFLLPSICPETFSFACSEIMSMGLPLICFDLGAPAERVGDYEKGLVLPLPRDYEEEAPRLLDSILSFAKSFRE